jgi:pimeloyl-ACP methyl ester carboxylesterase
MTLTRIAGPAGTLAVDDGGRGSPPVVFLHSLAGTGGQWRAQLEHLRPTRRAVALDFRGHGGSAAPADGDYALASLAGDVAAAVDGLGLERFALVGHSLGGGVALVFAAARPERVERLMLLDPIGDGTRIPREEVDPFLAALDSPAYAATIEGYWGSIAGRDPALAARLLADLRATPREAVVTGLRAVSSFDPGPALAGLRVPALAVVTPDNDAPFSLHRVGGFPHQVIAGTGHWIQLERPEEVNRILDRFLGEH